MVLLMVALCPKEVCAKVTLCPLTSLFYVQRASQRLLTKQPGIKLSMESQYAVEAQELLICYLLMIASYFVKPMGKSVESLLKSLFCLEKFRGR